ncbi:glycosyltransferase family 2 protein (plasmid) [Legionella lytica]|uniref:Glycosyltransferase family 2 protein n=1 Tax=Legionella lytica TaxID=96232 RepID=A0ABY4YDC6_9GAMM|nr:glycosyltransferase family 2 protein [Legionella lytica]USQ15413.1 glycosyltransferase family 2 protein [Legionella lytica]
MIKHICILIPAKNEEKLLPRCLYSIINATQLLPKSIHTDIICCVDSSSDNTFKIAQNIIGPQGIVLEISEGNVGFARRYATEEALNRYQGSLEACWLANTDADCEVPKNWLANHILWANQGTHALAGIVKVDSYSEHESQVPELFQNQYIIYEDDSHPHIHGANLGIRADVYLRTGGWKPLVTAEDHDLWNRMKTLSLNLKSHADCFVITSGRKQGRAPHGFAEKLTSFNGRNYGQFRE